MNIALFKANMKLNWVLLLIFLAILFMYISVIITMYDPDNIDSMLTLAETMPEGMMEAFGYAGIPTDLNTFVALYYYGFIIYMFPMIYCIILGNRLVASHVDSGSMAYLLATPNTRVTIVTTQAAYLATSVIFLLLLNTAAAIATSAAIYPGELDPGPFITLNLVAITLTLAVSSICFFFSCMFNESRFSLALGGGVPILFFLINMLRNVSGQYSWLEYLTIYSLFDASAIITGEQSPLGPVLFYVAITLLLYGAGIYIFSRRNLYL